MSGKLGYTDCLLKFTPSYTPRKENGMQKFIIFFILFLTACGNPPQAETTVQSTNTLNLLASETSLPTNTQVPTHPLYGKSNGVIAFFSDRDGNTEIYTINLNDNESIRNPLRLTTSSVGEKAPAISPDGTRIAFMSDMDIYVMDIDGTDRQRLTNTPAYDSHPGWSPDGTRIVFISERDGNREIYTMNVDGTNIQRLTNDPADDMRPNWSPNGTQILFNSERDGNWEIYVMDVNGSNVRRLTETSKWELFPQWSPDGTQIAYTLATPNRWDQKIYVMNADGTNEQRLTDRSASENPIWSPDGSQIVFHSDRSGNFEIYIMNADGSNQQCLTNNPAGDYWPSWGP